MSAIEAEPTPNPNSLKFTAGHGSFRDDGVAAYASAAEAEGVPLAERLFTLDGVADVFVTPSFVTVSKQEGADWSDLRPDIEAVLADILAPSN